MNWSETFKMFVLWAFGTPIGSTITIITLLAIGLQLVFHTIRWVGRVLVYIGIAFIMWLVLSLLQGMGIPILSTINEGLSHLPGALGDFLGYATGLAKGANLNSIAWLFKE